MAIGSLGLIWMGLAVAAPYGLPLRTWRLGLRRGYGVPVAVWAGLASHVLLAGVAALLLLPALTRGAIHWEDDTKYFYYPLLAALSAALKEGRLLLWEPGIFGGYPLFGDGEAGMLYPPHVVALRLLEPPQALVALRLLRFYLAGAFTYAFLRSLGCTRTAGIAGGTAFMCSGFMVGQVVHENLASGMVWLPLALYFVERSVGSVGWARYRLAAFAGVALGIQALAVHVQVCVFSALAVFPYLGWRALWRSPLRAHVMDRLGIAVSLSATVGVTAFGLAAVQLLPLLDVADRSARGHGIGLSAATINSVTPFRLFTILFPELLRRPDGAPFGHWVDWDVAVSTGTPALLFALVAVLLRREAFTLFFALLAGLSLALSMGRYGPPWVVLVTQDLLGDHGLRSPGRFAFLWSFGVAVLAGLGLDWLMRPRARHWAVSIQVGLAGGVLAGLTAGLLLAARLARGWLSEHPEQAVAWIERQFMLYDRSVRLKATAAEVHASLLQALDPTSSTVRLWVLGLVGAYAVFVGWCLLHASARRGGPAVRRLLYGCLGAASVTFVAAPLVGAAGRAHPAEPVSAITPDSPSAAFLRDQLAPPGVPTDARPLYRLYTGQSVYLGRSDVEPNALLPLGLHEAGGYSSLSSERHLAYAWAAETSAGTMLDVWNARYFLSPNLPQPLPSHELTSFHPERPLVSGAATNAGSHAWFRVPAVESENVRVVATLRDAWAARPGDVAAWVAAEDTEGTRHVWPLRVGLEIAEATSADPAMRGQRPPELAADPTFPLAVHVGGEYGADGKPFPVRLYYARLPLPAVTRIVRIGVQAVPLAGASNAILRVHGLGAGQPDWHVHNVVWSDRERFTQAFVGPEVRVYRNGPALPRAYLVPLAVTLPQGEHVKQMAERAFDPQRMLLLDAASAQSTQGAQGGAKAHGSPTEPAGTGSWFSPPAAPFQAPPRVVEALDEAGRSARSAVGESRIVSYTADRVEITVDAVADAWLFLADSYDPSWRATVDGQAAPIYLANGMFRAVPVPAGAHTVTLRYEPPPLRRGAAISLGTGLVVLAVAAGGVAGLARARWRLPAA